MDSSPRRVDQSLFSDEEKAAVRAYAAEVRATRGLKGQAKRDRQAADAMKAISEMPDQDRLMAEALDTIIAQVAPELEPRTWYGMPAYSKDDKVLCFFQAASKFNVRYATLGFNETAALDDGSMWATSFAITDMTESVAERIRDLLRRAVGHR